MKKQNYLWVDSHVINNLTGSIELIDDQTDAIFLTANPEVCKIVNDPNPIGKRVS